MPCSPEFPGYTRSRSIYPTASGGQKASLNRAKNTSATSTPSTEGDRQEGGELRPTRDRMPAREKDYRSRAGDAPLTSPYSSLCESYTASATSPTGFSFAPRERESAQRDVNGSYPHGSAGSAGLPGVWGAFPRTPPDLSGPMKPRADPGADFRGTSSGDNFRGRSSG